MIKAIILDWGGVLIDDPVPGFMAYCSKFFAVPEEVFIKNTAKFYEDFARGKITESAFWGKACACLNVAEPSVDSLLIEAFSSVYLEKSDVILFVSALKNKGYKIALLSNTEMPMVDYFRKRNYDFFDFTVFSCVEGFIKPEKEIYEITLGKLNMKPEETVFIDDKQENVLAAKNLRMNTVLFKTPGQFKEELISLL
jgi:putative hydrolase of the HAD superfamily